MPLFLDSLTEPARADVRAVSNLRRFGRSEVVFHEGDPGSTIHIIESGLFAAQSHSTGGHVLTVNAFGRGAIFGELAVLSTEPVRSASVVCLRVGQTRMIHKRDFDDLRHRYPEIDAFLVSLLVERTQVLTALLIEQLFTPTHRRVRRELWRLHDIGIARSDDNVWICLSQDDIATLTATTRSTVNRVFRELEEQGIIELGRGRCRVVDEAALRKAAR
jgi:CRP/FNR family transcriptional regulator, cyclic AMP receptor protein